MSYSTTKSYVLRSYDGGKIEQSYTSLTAGNTISYTIVPNAGYKIKLLELYRFDTPTLSSVSFDRATKVATLDFDNPKYTITNDDLGKSLCIKAEFEKLSTFIYRHNVEHGTISQSTYTGDLNDTVTYTVTPDNGYKAGNITMYRFKDPVIKSLDLTKGTVIATLTPDDNGHATYKLTADDLGHAIVAVPSFPKTETVSANLFRGHAEHGTIKQSTFTGYLNDIDTYTLTPDTGYKAGTVVLYRFNEYELHSVDLSKGTKIATLTPDDNNLARYKITADDLGHAIVAVPSFTKVTPTFIGVVHDFNGQVKYTIKGGTVTITPDDNLKLYSLYGNVFPYSSGRPEKINATIDNNVATLVIPNAYLNNRHAVLSLYYEFIKTVESLGVTDDTKQNTTVSVKNNTITITPDVGYNIISANLYTINSYDYARHKTNETSFKIENNIATLTFDKVQDLRDGYEIHVSYETKKQETQPKDETKKQETQPKDENPNTGTNVIRLYEVDDETLDKISKKDITVFQNESPQRYEFQSFINQLYKLPFAIPESYLTTTNQIITGYFTVDAPAYKINEENYSLKIGSITVPTTNGFDYNIKDISLILPWLPTVKLASSDILGKTISIVYNLSFLDGTTTVVIKSDNTIVESFQNNIAQNLELFNIYSNRENGSLNSTLQNDLRQAYIKINYYKPVDNLISYPTNEHGTLKDYHGFTKVKNIILSKSINADIDDLIINQLKQGVIINGTKRN